MKCRQTGLDSEVYAKLGQRVVNMAGGEIDCDRMGRRHRGLRLGLPGVFKYHTRWQKQNADAIEEMIRKHGVQIRRTPPGILLASLKAWDEVAAEHSAKSATFKKVYESQRAYAAKVVPAKRYMFPPYSFAANYYGPQQGAPAMARKDVRKP